MGRVRIHPLTCPGGSIKDDLSSLASSSSAQDEYQAIISKCIQQSQVVDNDNDDESKTKENAKLRKRYMKEGVAMASTYLTSTLGIDVSIIDVEIVLNNDCIIETDGCLASCFLDAGCASIVIRVKEEEGEGVNTSLAKALEACDATRVPKERLTLHYKHDMMSTTTIVANKMEDISSRVGTVSVQMNPLSSSCTDWSNIIPSLPKDIKCVVQLSLENNDTSNSNNNNIEDLISSVSSLSKAIGENKGCITLVDLTAEQFGLCYAACMKTDRPDGLYTTVVCTRSNEALGLVYSSKVCPYVNLFRRIVRCMQLN